MKFKFKPQTALMVGGLLAATYASACWIQGSTAVCFTSGTTVDRIHFDQVGWNSSAGTISRDVIATQDWKYNATNSATSLVYSGSQSGSGHASYTGAYPYSPTTQILYCGGPAKFQDAAGQWCTVSEWVNDSIDGGSHSGQPPTIYDQATTSGSTTCS
jgi:hypothetical protein